MPNNIRSFRAANVADALAQIRREMGLEAVVIESREVTHRSLFPWVAPRTEIEILAKYPPKRNRKSPASGAMNADSMNSTSVASVIDSMEDQSSVATALVTGTRSKSVVPNTTNTIAATVARQSSRHPMYRPVTQAIQSRELHQELNQVGDIESARRQYDLTGEVGKSENSERVASLEVSQPRPLAKAIEQTRLRHRESVIDEAAQNALIETDSAFMSDEVSEQVPVRVDLTALEERLDALQRLIVNCERRPSVRGLFQIPPELFPHYLSLVESDVDDEIARDLIAKLHRQAVPGQLEDVTATSALLTAIIEREIPCDNTFSARRGLRQTAMLIGPTGVGKTTTLAKLAGRLSLLEGLQVGLITVDTYRVAAVDQLRAYADISGLPLEVVDTPEAMSVAMQKFDKFDVVLIDTAGRNPNDEQQIQELKPFVEVANPDAIHLVLSAASGAKSLCSAAARFAAIRPTSAVITKLDEAIGCGALLTLLRETSLAISYITMGQEVPRDVEPANPTRLARMILGRDLHRTS